MSRKRTEESSNAALDAGLPPENAPPPGHPAPSENAGERNDDEADLFPPPRLSAEVLPAVDAAAATITGCSDAEMKNFLSTADFVCRQMALHLADKWKQICKTAGQNAKEDKSAKVALATAINIDLTNPLIMDTKIKTSFSEKHSVESETQEDLRQVEFQLRV